jgi:pimeloyl-ACP methyl ester carboxylesterase
MMIHGTGGGFDQGLLFAHRLRESGFQIIAPSRFGYLRSTFPVDASPAHQADVLVELLDHRGIATAFRSWADRQGRSRRPSSA